MNFETNTKQVTKKIKYSEYNPRCVNEPYKSEPFVHNSSIIVLCLQSSTSLELFINKKVLVFTKIAHLVKRKKIDNRKSGPSFILDSVFTKVLQHYHDDS
jgi:hypothetical protein